MGTFLDSIWKHGERTALIDSSGNRISYNKLEQMVNDLSFYFSDFPSLAILICKNTSISVTGYLSCITRGVVPLLLPSNTTSHILNKFITTYRPKYLFLDGGIEHDSYRRIMEIDDFCLYVSEDTRVPKINSNLRLLLTTSGTTGSPKLVRLSDENLRINCEMICTSLPMRADDIAITTLPFNYSYGLSIINTHFLQGSAIQLNEYSLMQRAFWDLLYKSKATTFGGVPFHYQQIEQVGFERILNSSVRYLTQAGGKLQPEILERIYKFCDRGAIEFFVMYGQTEASPRISVLNPSDAKEHPGSIGKAIAPGEFWLSPLSNELKVQNHVAGELVFRGGNVAMGYAQDATDLRLGDEWNGVLRTGDLAYFDEEGFPYIVGRVNRFGKIRGIRVSLDDLETLFQEIDINIVAIEVKDQIFIVTSQDIDFNLVDKALRDTIGLRFIDFVYRKIESIPHTQSGKVDYHALSGKLGSGEAS